MKSLGSTASEIRVFMVLYSSRKFLSVSEIEKLSNLSSKSVRNALKKLKERKLVVEKKKDGKSVFRSVSNKELLEQWKKMVEDALSHLFRRP